MLVLHQTTNRSQSVLNPPSFVHRLGRADYKVEKAVGLEIQNVIALTPFGGRVKKQRQNCYWGSAENVVIKPARIILRATQKGPVG